MAFLSLLAGEARLEAQEPTPQPEAQQEEEPPQEERQPSRPGPPEGILPVGEIARLGYSPGDRPLVMLHGDLLIVITASGAVEAREASTGEFRWKLGLPRESLHPPVVFREKPFELLLSSADGRIFLVEGESGRIGRELELPFPLAHAPLPSLSGPVFAGTPEGDIVAFDAETGIERFRIPGTEPPSALASSGSLLAVSGSERTFSGIDIGTGTVRWTLRSRSPFHAPAAFASDRLYVGNDSGEFWSIDAGNGDTRYSWSTGAAIRHPALVEERRVYVATYGNNLYCYQAGGGAELWRVSLPGRPASGPVRIGRRLLVATYDGAIVEVDPDGGKLGRDFTAPGELASAPAFLVAAPAPLPPPGSAELPAGAAWYELHRIALPLRTGEVLLLGHEADEPKEPEPKKETPPPTTR